VILSEIEQRRQAIAQEERAAHESRYRKLAFAYAERELDDAEIIEIADLAAKLGLPASAPDDTAKRFGKSDDTGKSRMNRNRIFAALESRRIRRRRMSGLHICRPWLIGLTRHTVSPK